MALLLRDFTFSQEYRWWQDCLPRLNANVAKCYANAAVMKVCVYSTSHCGSGNPSFPVWIQNISKQFIVSEVVFHSISQAVKKKVRFYRVYRAHYQNNITNIAEVSCQENKITHKFILNNSKLFYKPIFGKAHNLQKGLNETIHIIIIIVSKHWHCETVNNNFPLLNWKDFRQYIITKVTKKKKYISFLFQRSTLFFVNHNRSN